MMIPLILLFLALGTIPFQMKGANAEEKIPFDSLPQWINQHVMFPHDALKYGTVGVERFVVKVAWNGKPYISCQLSTLNPETEKAIVDVVEKAPLCSFSEDIPNNKLYKLIEIDFYKLLASEKDKKTMTFIPQHTAPIFTGLKLSAAEGRKNFIRWLSSACCSSEKDFPEVLVQDTLSLVYTVDTMGKVRDVNVMGQNKKICELLTAKANKSPYWIPAHTDDRNLVSITVKERLVALFDETGKLFFLTSIPYTACYNSAEAPTDSTIIIENPAEPARYADDAEIRSLIHKKLSREKRLSYKASFIVELDGSISELEAKVKQTNDDWAEKVLTDLLMQSHWNPARQGGKAVRARHSISDFWSQREQSSDYYPDFMLGSSLPPFVYDPLYDKGLQKRWRKLQMAYPELNGEINGYAKSRRLTKDMYKEMMMQKGHR